ncbi:MAG TPA: hypothetical protein VKE88_03700 [Candidatus Nanoarchaeia archaeon]|nr:hypothetical protein [Candidatus Nanoarchaeia archaeon]
MKSITEGLATIEVSEQSKISKKLEVFYNPVMKVNRDITVSLLNAVPNKNMRIADIMSGTGVRSIRFAKELKKGKVEKLFVNDMSSIDKAKKNFKKNKAKAEFSSLDANEFLVTGSGFDYIDIDPFGTPIEFLDNALKRIARDGILGVTATDTSALCGTYPSACVRKYWATPCINGFMHESALRILIRRVQLIGAQHDKACIPILSYAKDHYVRIFFKCIKGKEKVDEILKQHAFILFNPKTLAYEVSTSNTKKDHVAIGPLYVGSLSDKSLLKKMKTPSEEAQKLLKSLLEEKDIVGCYDIHDLCGLLRVETPSFENLLKKTNGTRTHYNGYAIKTTKTVEEIKKLL